MNAALTSDPRFRSGMAILVELSALDASGLSAGDIEQISAEIAERDWNFPARAVALVTPGSQTFERVRLAVAHLGGSKSHRRLFATRDEALAWLHEQ